MQNPSVENALALAAELALPASVQQRLAAALTQELLAAHAAACAGLTGASTAPGAWKELEAALADRDEDGMQLLGLYLAAACLTREKYRQAGVPGEVFTATMGCFGRFLEERRARTGEYAFDRGFWAWRQLACLLFRLGTLEFEYMAAWEKWPLPPGIAPGAPVLSVHIPSDGPLAAEPLRDSYARAARFFAGAGAAFCAEGPPLATLCGTWLLAPPLLALLPPTSGIRRFADAYDIYAADGEDDSFYLWLFGGKKPPAPLPQETSLQRAVAAHLQKGGRIGLGFGLLKPPAN